MTSLLDIAPDLARETVMVRGEPIEVRALTVIEFARLLRRFPSLLDSVGQGPAGNVEAIPALIAAGCDHYGDEKFEEAAARLSMDELAALAGVIMRLSMPEQSGPLGNGSAIGPQSPAAPTNGSPEPLRN